MIDLRSDTVTRPSNEMREAMFNAKVGDDVYGEDPTVNELQEFAADMFGKEAALFVPSGTMANQLSLMLITETGDEVITESESHIYYYETAAPAILSRIQFKTIPSDIGQMPLLKIKKSIRPDIYYFPKTSAICLENTHNRNGGTIMGLDYIKEVRILANQHGLKMHLDGARLWNAIVETGVRASEWAEHFDTINVCLSKGLGAPVGSLLISSRENIDKAWKLRKILGGGMRQAGMIAAGGLYALQNNVDKLIEDHEKAKNFVEALKDHDFIEVDENRAQTNIVAFQLHESVDGDVFRDKCAEKGLLLHHLDNNMIRVVFHLDISFEQVKEAVSIIEDVLYVG